MDNYEEPKNLQFPQPSQKEVLTSPKTTLPSEFRRLLAAWLSEQFTQSLATMDEKLTALETTMADSTTKPLFIRHARPATNLLRDFLDHFASADEATITHQPYGSENNKNAVPAYHPVLTLSEGRTSLPLPQEPARLEGGVVRDVVELLHHHVGSPLVRADGIQTYARSSNPATAQSAREFGHASLKIKEVINSLGKPEAIELAPRNGRVRMHLSYPKPQKEALAA